MKYNKSGEMLFAKKNPIFFMSWGTCRLTSSAIEHICFSSLVTYLKYNRYFKFAAETDKDSLSIMVLSPCNYQFPVYKHKLRTHCVLRIGVIKIFRNAMIRLYCLPFLMIKYKLMRQAFLFFLCRHRHWQYTEYT